MLEENYTSNPQKLLYHKKSIKSYIEKNGRTVISTHISPESICNLKCSYCSVDNRDITQRLEFSTIVDYIFKLKSRGLKSVIITGGGEPTIYPKFNELVEFLYKNELKIGLITNGTLCKNIKTWKLFSWIRISVNFENDAYAKIKIPTDKLDKKCIVGGSHIFDNMAKDIDECNYRLRILNDVAVRNNFAYVRLVTDCNDIDRSNICKNISYSLNNLYFDKIDEKFSNFFIQDKKLEKSTVNTCHQSYFRPYLSEVNGGSVFPCDSVVLNNTERKFINDYILCKPVDILDYMDGKIGQKFDINTCTKCAFNDNNEFIQAQLSHINDNFVEVTNDNQYFI